MHELSLGTWFIHIATLFEWTLAIVLITVLANATQNSSLRLLGFAMLPNLASALAAITWHVYDNTLDLKGLVVIQAFLTMIGNSLMALAAWNLVKFEKKEA